MFLASDAKMGASLSSAALQVTPEKANAVLTPIFFPPCEPFCKGLCTGHFRIFFGVVWSLLQQAGPSGQGQ